MSGKTIDRVKALVWTSAFIALGACGAEVEEPGIDIPTDIYEENVWDAAEADVRVAALRRDVRAEMSRLSALEPRAREQESKRLLRLMSNLRAEWGKAEGGSEEYAAIEVEIEALLEEDAPK